MQNMKTLNILIVISLIIFTPQKYIQLKSVLREQVELFLNLIWL